MKFTSNEIEQVARMLMKGLDPDAIAIRMSRPPSFIDELCKSQAVKDRHKDLMVEKMGSDLYDDDTIFSSDQLNAEVDRLTKPALRALREVLEDTRASASAKVKAAEMALSWQKVIADRSRAKAGEEGVKYLQQIILDGKASDALKRIADEFSGDDWLDKLDKSLTIMPENRL